MSSWNHYSFRQTLKNKAKQFGVTVSIANEAYTSKTCDKCGTIHTKLGGNKVFKCPKPGCGHIADRDAHAAKNILLRLITMGIPQKCWRLAGIEAWLRSVATSTL